MTIAEALDVSQRSVSFRDAEVLLAEALKRNDLTHDRAWIIAHPEFALPTTIMDVYQDFLSQRESNKPVAYITGHKEFFGRDFACDQRALIPRPETEHLVQATLDLLTQNPAKTYAILELGTGCGNIITTLAAELTTRNQPFSAIATDIAPEALSLAQQNATNHTAAHIQFIQADLFDHPDLVSHQADVLIANLPYVEDTWRHDPQAQADVVFFEPEIALFGGPDGLDIYRRFFTQAAAHLTSTGFVIIEYGERQTEYLLPIIKAAMPDYAVTVHQDYAGLDRYVIITKK
jgi:release factor glutamine methyltransferase